MSENPQSVPPESAVKGNSSAARSQGPRVKRRLWPWVFGIALVALIIAGLWPKPLSVEVGTAAMGPLKATVNEEGRTRLKQRYVVAAPVSGQLRRIPYKAGMEVHAGETLIAVIDPLPPALLDLRSRALSEAKRDTAAANLERAKAQHVFATSELRRIEKLAEARTVSAQDFENTQWREVSAAKDKAAAESALRQAEAELAEFNSTNSLVRTSFAPVEIKAPIDGRVLRVMEESARPVTAGAPIVELGDARELEVIVEVLSRDGAAIAAGAKAWLEHWGGAKPLEAKVRLVEPSGFTKISALGVEEQRVNVIADIVTPYVERPNLGDQFRVEARIVVWESDNVLKVPSGSLFRRGNQWAVFAVEGGQARLKEVKPGHSSMTETEILSGLEAGAQVILYPGDRIQDSTHIRVLNIAR